RVGMAGHGHGMATTSGTPAPTRLVTAEWRVSRGRSPGQRPAWRGATFLKWPGDQSVVAGVRGTWDGESPMPTAEFTLEQEQAAFEAQLDRLLAEHPGEYALFKNGKPVGFFPDH